MRALIIVVSPLVHYLTFASAAANSLGVVSFYDEWLVRVFVIPFLLVGLVCMRYSFEKRRGEAADAAGNLRANICE